MKNKIKTKKAAAKRFKITGSGKIMKYSSGLRHILEHKSKDSKRNKQGATEISPSDERKVKGMLPGI